jgi:5-(carboxyamino)imidazole ribonucleotide synthase
MTAATRLLPGATLGVLGGGQLGRMFVHAAQRLGYRTVVLDPDPASPAGTVAHRQIVAAYEDPAGLASLAAACDAITTEFENVPAAALDRLAQQRPVAPSAAAVAVCQHRAREKSRFRDCGVPCAPSALIETEGDRVAAAAPAAGLLPGLLKTATLGYDGKGQATVYDARSLAEAWQGFGRVACLLERKLALEAEISVVVARSAAGEIVHLPVARNLHRGGILAVTQLPAPGVAADLVARAIAAAGRVAASMDYVGVLCVEFFVLADGSLVANEMAPRPHNSGHASIEACDVSQFELQVRCLAGLPLVAPRLVAPAVMLNLLGDLWRGPDDPPDWAAVLAQPGTHLHLYGKAEARPGRKMGHLTITAATEAQALDLAREAAGRLGIAPW